MSRAKALLPPSSDGQSRGGAPGDHSWSPGGPPLPSDFKRRVLAETLEDAFFPSTREGPSEGPSLVYRKKTILQSFVYGREPLLLTSSGNPLVKSKGFTRHPPLPSDFKRRVLRAETLEDAFSSVHKSLGVPLRDPLLCTGRKRSSRVSSMGEFCS